MGVRSVTIDAKAGTVTVVADLQPGKISSTGKSNLLAQNTGGRGQPIMIGDGIGTVNLLVYTPVAG